MLVEEALDLDPFAQQLFVFCNRKRDKVKILYWERSGFVLWYKRLEKARFPWPDAQAEEVVSMTGRELNWLLDGIDLFQLKPHASLAFRGPYNRASGEVVLPPETRQMLALRPFGVAAVYSVIMVKALPIQRHCWLAAMHAKAPSTAIARAVHIHPTVGAAPTVLHDWKRAWSGSIGGTSHPAPAVLRQKMQWQSGDGGDSRSRP